MAAALPSFTISSALEKVLEHRFVAELATTLWLGGTTGFEILRSEVDAHGHDLVIEAGNVLRHIQLKAMVAGGRRREVSINLRLAAKPSGCVVWIIYDPATLALGPFLWFGGILGAPLPPTGDRTARHSRGNAAGVKGIRGGHRLLPRSRFVRVDGMGELCELLFGPAPTVCTSGIELLTRNLAKSTGSAGVPAWEPWLDAVLSGDFNAIPRDIGWGSSLHLAHLVDGYALVRELGYGDPFAFEWDRLQQARKRGAWSGGPAELWACLFLEHRRWRTANMGPDPAAEELLDRLCGQLRQALTRGPA